MSERLRRMSYSSTLAFAEIIVQVTRSSGPAISTLWKMVRPRIEPGACIATIIAINRSDAAVRAMRPWDGGIEVADGRKGPRWQR